MLRHVHGLRVSGWFELWHDTVPVDESWISVATAVWQTQGASWWLVESSSRFGRLQKREIEIRHVVTTPSSIEDEDRGRVLARAFRLYLT